MKKKYSIILGILLSIFLIGIDVFLPAFAGKEFVTVDNKKYEIIKNHTRDKDVEIFFPAADFLFEYTPETLEGFNWPKPGSFGYAESVVYIGIDKEGNGLSFICPQGTTDINVGPLKGRITKEVEVGTVGGKIDTKTGEGVLLAGDLAWKLWGDFEIDGKSITLDKKNAAIVPIKSSKNKDFLVMNNIKKSSREGVSIDKVFASFVVSGVQDDPRGIQKGLLQSSLIELINYQKPGLFNNKTKIQWNIDLQAPQSISGRKYKKMAEDLHMDGTIHSH